MGMDDKETIFRAAATGGILGTLAATVRTLLANNEPPWQKIRNFVAGVIMSILVALLLRASTWKEIIMAVCGAFVSSFWPLLEKQINKIIKKKTDAISNSDLP
jgi:sulfite exporter TauE/SafE